MPFTKEQFFEVFRQYNEGIWPVQVAGYLLGFLVLWLTLRGSTRAFLILALFWIWNGIVYHWAYFASINPAARVFGVLFVIQGLLFLVEAGSNPRAKPISRLRMGLGIAAIAYALVLYPLIGAALGHSYPSNPVFGVAPCPTTIFTFGILLLVPTSPFLLIVPCAWAVVGAFAAIRLGVPEDLGLPVFGLSTALACLYDRKKSSQQNSQEAENPPPAGPTLIPFS